MQQKLTQQKGQQNWLQPDEGLAYCQLNKQLYYKVLHSFYRQYHYLKQRSQLTPESTAQLAHSLQSTAPPGGALRLAKLAKKLAPPAPLPEPQACKILLDAVQHTLVAIEAYLPEPQQENRTKDLLSQLEQHNIEAIKLFKEWSAQEAKSWPSEYQNQIHQALLVFDFKQAYNLLLQGLKKFALES
ncbi:hypothetical protein CWE09_07120 [Aliidiomarina minuta]|uniref:Uncharacterized protein n=1 Tax=Aliidiomarina minuta TaxID=880057 RepID=A0A432W8U7_9GAMM|nr:hypothetical protein [Aliidiomarina minuta]RUO26471.1 hypothetical protein CWE09_07120 [Aliidiomarina minuta]